MTDRLPTVDGAQACPFVAFEHDRDQRATSPDPRHRCYAETRPGPRALAHQEAYCLSSAFPVCPTFQDWARREAARAAGGGVAASSDASSSAPGREPVARSAPGTWPGSPSLAGGASAAGAYGREDEDGGEGAPGFLGPRPGPGSGLAGSSADRVALGGGAEPPEARPAWPADARAMGRPGMERDAGPAAAAGAFAAGGAIGGVRDPDREPGADGLDDGFFDDDRVADGPPYGRVEERPGRDRRGIFGGRDKRPRVGDTRRGQEEEAPSWERPRRYEAYPTIKTRGRMPGISRVALAALALVAAAIGVFMLPSLLVGNGPTIPGAGGPSPSATAGASASASVAPTPVPSPTPFTYTVVPKDTLTKIAKKFGVTIEQILAANPTIKDPNKVGIGDKIVIPTPSPSGAPSGAPSGTPSATP